jgi:hypothetical protein
MKVIEEFWLLVVHRRWHEVSKKEKNILIKNNITRYVTTIGGNIKAFVAFLETTIP